MADEAIIVELLGNGGDPVSFTVNDSVGIEKGAILKMTDARTAIINSGAGDVIAGIAAAEKVASDGNTKLAVYTNGIFDIKVVSGQSATVGKFQRVSATVNQIQDATSLDHETGKAVGRALETGSASETIQVRVLL